MYPKMQRPLTAEEKHGLHLAWAGLPPAAVNKMARGVNNRGLTPTDVALMHLEEVECLQATIERMEYELQMQQRTIESLERQLDQQDANLLAMVDEVLSEREADTEPETDGALISLTDLGWAQFTDSMVAPELEYVDVEEEGAAWLMTRQQEVE